MDYIEKQKIRLQNFEYLMNVLDEAEGERNTEIGAFSFLWENSYVREVVVTPSKKTSIASLKTFLATEVLEIFGANSKSKISYKNIYAYLSGDTSKKYSFSFQVLDEVFDIEKNKEMLLEDCLLLQKEGMLREETQKTDIWFPYLLMCRLRDTVWEKLRKFFRLCNKETCEDENKKNEVYFQFIQAVTLYEIFLIECIQEKGVAYIEQSMSQLVKIERTMENMKEKVDTVFDYIEEQKEEALLVAKSVYEKATILEEVQVAEFLENASAGMVFQILNADLGISFLAMCHLLMVFEAMNVCSENMRGIKRISLKIMDELFDVYKKDFVILQIYNKNRISRYKKVNEKLKKILEEYGDETYKESAVIGHFIEELCKPVSKQNKVILRDLECKIARPIYMELSNR